MHSPKHKTTSLLKQLIATQPVETQTSSVDNLSIRFGGLISIRYYAGPLAASRALATCLRFVVSTSMCTAQDLAPV